jgi:23S rRNA-intervening sequence protein
MKDFRELKVWEMARQLTVEVSRETNAFPREELYGLTSQVRRCSASIASNIARAADVEEMAKFIGSWRLLRMDAVYQAMFKDLSQLRKMPTSLIVRVDAERHRAQC